MNEFDKKRIDDLTHYEMAYIYRFAKSGHPYFITGSEEYKYFMEKFDKLGGMTSTLSKQLGWDY